MTPSEIDQVKLLMEFEAARSEPPAGFPTLPDLPGGRYTDPRFHELEKAHLWLIMVQKRGEQKTAVLSYKSLWKKKKALKFLNFF